LWVHPNAYNPLSPEAAGELKTLLSADDLLIRYWDHGCTPCTPTRL